MPQNMQNLKMILYLWRVNLYSQAMKYTIAKALGLIATLMLAQTPALTLSAQEKTQAPTEIKKKKNAELKRQSAKFFASAEARRIGDQVLLYQRVTGGWPKNLDMCTPFSPAMIDSITADKNRKDDSTIDNNATTTQMAYLARLYKATGDEKYRDAVRRGIEFLLSGQYPSGGWPQFWPENHGYQIHITYNDNAMVNTMKVIRDMVNGHEPYEPATGIVTDEMRERLSDSFKRGIECILATQIVTDGKPTVWCQQHYRDTYAPAPARAYELPSYCSNESAGIVDLLMELPEPDARVRRSIHGAMLWLDEHKITGYRIAHVDTQGNPNTTLVADDTAAPIWARFYDLEHGEPYVCDRDGIPRRHLEEIGSERRNGYGWYNRNVADLYDRYAAWCLQWGEKMEKIDLNGKGSN